MTGIIITALALIVTMAKGYVIQPGPHTSYGVPLQSAQMFSSNERPQQFLESSQFGSSSSSFSSSNSNSIQSSGESFQSSSQTSHQQEPEIFKHIYVHVAPEEQQPTAYRPQVALPRPKKHYKIIFIKAPEPPAPIPPQVALQALNQEKTLVYVLLKQQDEAANLILPSAIPTEPSKPEVYFIKYKSKKENVASSSSSSSSLSSSSASTSSGSYDESSSSNASSSSLNSQNLGGSLQSASGSFSDTTGGFISDSGSSSSSSSSSSDSSGSSHRPAQAYGPPGYY